MTQDPSYKLYLEEKFKSVDLRFDSVMRHINISFDNTATLLEGIENHVKHTNGNVAEAITDINNLKIEVIKHPMECDAIKEIQTVKDTLVMYNWVRNNPKTGIALLVIIISLFLMIYFDVSPKKKVTEQFVNTELIDYQKNIINELQDIRNIQRKELIIIKTDILKSIDSLKNK